MPHKIAVVVHHNDLVARLRPYIVWRLQAVWEQRGIIVELVRGTDRDIDADVVFPHLDLTEVPDDYVQYLDQFPCVVNRQVTDISKRHVSRNLVSLGDEWQGPVIVKTNRNWGGMADARLLGKHAPTRLRGDAVDYVTADRLHPSTYPIFDSVKDLPDGVFDNEALVVERFLPETDGEHYYLRSYMFCGDQYTSSRKRSGSPIVKAASVDHRELVPVREEIEDLRRHLGFDYGKFDYVVHEGDAVLLDVSTTPTYTARRLTDERRRAYARLADGIGAIAVAARRARSSPDS